MKKEKDSAPRLPLTPALDLFEESLKTWWKNLRGIVGIYLQMLYWSSIPLAVIMIFSFLAEKGLGQNLVARISTGTVVFLAVLFLIYLFIQAYVAIILFIKNGYQGDPKGLFREARVSVWPYLWLELLTTVLLLLWFLLLIIPAIIFSVFYSFAIYAFFFEGKKGMAAIRRSKELVKGYWWPVFWRTLVVGLVFWIFGMIINLPLIFLPEGSLGANIWNFFVQIINLLAGPLSAIYFYGVFKELVAIKRENKSETAEIKEGEVLS